MKTSRSSMKARTLVWSLGVALATGCLEENPAFMETEGPPDQATSSMTFNLPEGSEPTDTAGTTGDIGTADATETDGATGPDETTGSETLMDTDTGDLDDD